MNQRLIYPDICKFIGIFLVTCSHCSQCISGVGWNNFLGGTHLDIAFNMPLFMLMSGWFINLDKMRKTPIGEYVSAKFRRLIIPSIVWYLLRQTLLLRLPELFFLIFYWYLHALFICLVVIMLFSKIIKNNLACALVSTLFIFLVPCSDFSNVNFMMPFLWAGYGLRRIFQTSYAPKFIVVCAILGCLLSLKWDHTYTVYLSAFNILYVDLRMTLICIYRFAIGFTISAVIIYLVMKAENTALKRLAVLGSYSLVIYTSSAVINSQVSQFLKYIGIHTNTYIIIDVCSVLLCLMIILLAVKFTDFCRKNKTLSMLFVGE